MFRNALIFSALLIAPVYAADFQVQAPVLAAKVYPQGASLTRAFMVDLPAGTHRVLLPVPPAMKLSNPPQIGGLGQLSVSAIEVLPDYILDPTLVYTAQQRRAFDALENAIERLQQEEDKQSRAEAVVLAGEIRIDFLRSIKAGGDSGLKVDELRDISTMLRDEVVEASLALQSAREETRLIQETVIEARVARDEAERDFARLLPPRTPVDMLAITLDAPEPALANLTLTHVVFAANWRPSYTMNLNRSNGVIAIERKISIEQSTGEVWSDIALSVSTGNPLAQNEPRPVEPNLAFIADTRAGRGAPSLSTRADAPSLRAEIAYDVVEEAVVALAPGKAIEGENIRYDFAQPVSISPAGGLLSLSLDELVLDSVVVNRAAPRFDQTAFTVARLSNTLDEPLLPGLVELSRDGVFVGQSQVPLIPAGGEAELAFGPVEGIRLEYKLLDNDTGDRGILTSSNTRNQEMEFSVENLTRDTTSVEALFALPFAEQEDLEIGVAARPAPDEMAVDDKRGVGRWDLELAPGEKTTVRVRVGLTWPEGFELIWRP
ncbi:MAG: DUF4139 domain-containing protein [Pseudomonadota bacterium]